MPIIPSTIAFATNFPEYSILSNAFQPFNGTGSITKQPIPIHGFTEQAVLNPTLEIFRTDSDSVQFPMPATGIVSKIRTFLFENDTTFTFDLLFRNETKTTSTTIFSNVGNVLGLLTNDSISINVDKGDLVNWIYDFGTNTPAVNKHIHAVYLSLNFKPTSSS